MVLLLGGIVKVMCSLDGGFFWSYVNGLLDWVFMEIIFDFVILGIVYVVCFGFGMDYVFKFEDGGFIWLLISLGLLDIFVNFIVVDFEQFFDLYVGNDLGVYVFFDYGQSWEWYLDGIVDVVMAMYLSIGVGCKFCLVIYGLGVYEIDFCDIVSIEDFMVSCF